MAIGVAPVCSLAHLPREPRLCRLPLTRAPTWIHTRSFMILFRTAIATLATCLALPVAAQGPAAKVEDPFLDHLVGHWEITRKIRDRVEKNSLEAEWVVQHRYVRLHMKDLADPPKYEAMVMVGFDPSKQRYVAHWTDSWGAQYSGVGYGKRSGDSIEFDFAGDDGSHFFNTFTWNPDSRAWRMLMESGSKDGARKLFAEDTVVRK